MKYIFSLSFIALLLGCSSQSQGRYSLVKNNAKQYIISQLHDPGSFEFVSMRLSDSVLYNNNIEYQIEKIESLLKYDQENLESDEQKLKKGGFYAEMVDREQMKGYKKNIDRYKKIIADIKERRQSLGDTVNQVASYTYEYTFWAKNAMGSKVMNAYTLQTGPAPTYSILKMTDDPYKILLNPGSFPGQNDIMSRYE